MIDIKSDLEALWIVFHEAILRFWNNRFNKSDEVQYLRDEILKKDEEIKRLTNLLIYFGNTEEDTEPQPEVKQVEHSPFNGYTPFHITRAKAERESFQRAKKLSDEAKNEIAKEKTTEQLESELLGTVQG